MYYTFFAAKPAEEGEAKCPISGAAETDSVKCPGSKKQQTELVDESSTQESERTMKVVEAPTAAEQCTDKA